MRAFYLVAGAALTLAACGGGGEAENTDANMMTDMNAGMTDMNVMDMNGMDANMTMNAADGMNATENAVVNDLTTNTPDANLANGM
jgi:actin-like ATPase involved in cell morphogenesis